MLQSFDRKVLRRKYGPIREEVIWKKWNKIGKIKYSRGPVHSIPKFSCTPHSIHSITVPSSTICQQTYIYIVQRHLERRLPRDLLISLQTNRKEFQRCYLPLCTLVEAMRPARRHSL